MYAIVKVTFTPPLSFPPKVRVEANIINKKYTMVAEEFYDMDNNRASMWIISNNTQDYMIFDYNNNQVIHDTSTSLRII